MEKLSRYDHYLTGLINERKEINESYNNLGAGRQTPQNNRIKKIEIQTINRRIKEVREIIKGLEN